MHIQSFDTHEALSRWVAEEITAAVRKKPDLLLCAATGESPKRTYALFCAQASGISAALRVVQLDEWGGLPPGADASCEAYLRRHLIDPLGIPEDRFWTFPVHEGTPEEACLRLAGRIAREGPIDLCLLGLGRNGHIGFIEPAEKLPAGAHVASLAPASKGHTMVAGLATAPVFGLTLGLRQILQARRVVLLVSGPGKASVAGALRRAEVSSRLPASFLWLHPRVDCVVVAG